MQQMIQNKKGNAYLTLGLIAVIVVLAVELDSTGTTRLVFFRGRISDNSNGPWKQHC
jgi:hypothetical protein